MRNATNFRRKCYVTYKIQKSLYEPISPSLFAKAMKENNCSIEKFSRSYDTSSSSIYRRCDPVVST